MKNVIEQITVLLECGKEKGNAVLIDEGHAITVAHCVKDAIEDQENIVLFYSEDGEVHEILATVADSYEEDDEFVLLDLDVEVNIISPVFCKGRPEPLEEYYIFGYDKNFTEQPTWHKVEAVGSSSRQDKNIVQDMIFRDASKEKSIAGLSGSPIVIDKDKNIILGLVSQERLEDKTSITTEGISAESQKEFFEKNDIPLRKAVERKKTEKNNWVHSNFSPNKDKVIGREGKLAEIEQKLHEQGEQGTGDSAISRLVFVQGIGGMGKSVLVKEYASKHRKEYDVIVEVSADSFESVVCGIAALWEDEKSGKVSDNFVQSLKYVEKQLYERKVLILVHDYNTDEKPGTNWDRLRCDCLVTTWNDKRQIGAAVMLEFSDLTAELAEKVFEFYYVKNGSGGRNKEILKVESKELRELVEYVDRHPLTLRLLAMQMTCDQCITPTEMLKELKEAGLQQRDEYHTFVNRHESGNDSTLSEKDAHGHLAEVFAINRKNMKDEEVEALRYMTLVSPVYGISRKRFSDWTGLNAGILNNLRKKGWLQYMDNAADPLAGYLYSKDVDYSVEKDKGCFYIPMIMGDTLYRQKDLQSNCENTDDFIQKWSDVDIRRLTLYVVRHALLQQSIYLEKHLAIENDERYASFLSRISMNLYYSVDSHENLEKPLEYNLRILEICRRALGEENADTASSYNNVGMSYEKLGSVRRRECGYGTQLLECWSDI